MPTYDYRCKECGHRFDVFQSMTEAALTDCPQCSAPALERLIGAGAGLLFKGSGFYLTDYKKSGSSSGSSSTSSSASSSNGGSTPSDASSSPSGTPASTESSGSST